MYLLHQGEYLVIPGDKYVRVSLCAPVEKFEEAINDQQSLNKMMYR